MIAFSPAKINVHLGIGGRRSDGYHEICSWFLKISLQDTISIDLTRETCAVSVEGNREVPLEQDLIFKAANLFYRETAARGGCRIHIEKRIPIGAGLGGGSSNAATVLRSLNLLYGHLLTADDTLRLASRLGSDVPFFMGGPSAIVSGRGDSIAEMPAPRTWWVVVVDPGFAISTKEAYGWLDAEPRQIRSSDLDCRRLRSLVLGPPEKWQFCNAFAPVLYRRYPLLERVCNDLAAAGALHATVSGSGSACFGLFSSREEAERGAAKAGGMRAWLKETLAS